MIEHNLEVIKTADWIIVHTGSLRGTLRPKDRGAPWAARMGLCSSRLSLEDRNPSIALQAEGEARGILRIVEHRD